MNTDTLHADPRFFPFQKEFFEQFTTRVAPGDVFLLRAPVGSGSTFTIVGTVSELVRAGAARRVLVLTRAPLTQQWAELVTEREQAATLLDARAFRLLLQDARGPSGWPEGWYVASIDFAKRSDVADEVLTQHWDIVVVDEAHALEGQRRLLIERLLAGDRSATLLFTSPLGIPHLQAFGRVYVVDWTGAVETFRALQGGRAEVRRVSATYLRPPAECALLAGLAAMADRAGPLAGATLLRRAASSYLALERTLAVHASGEKVIAADAERLLEQIDELGSDAKLDRFLGIIDDLHRDGHLPIVVFTDYTDTLHYLAGALRDHGCSCFHLHGGLVDSERTAETRASAEQGGVLIATTAGLQGLQLSFVRGVVHYDIPASPMSIAVRIGRFDRYGRTEPCVVYVLEDESGALPMERELLTLLEKVERFGVEVDVGLESLVRQEPS